MKVNKSDTGPRRCSLCSSRRRDSLIVWRKTEESWELGTRQDEKRQIGRGKALVVIRAGGWEPEQCPTGWEVL